MASKGLVNTVPPIPRTDFFKLIYLLQKVTLLIWDDTGLAPNRAAFETSFSQFRKKKHILKFWKQCLQNVSFRKNASSLSQTHTTKYPPVLRLPRRSTNFFSIREDRLFRTWRSEKKHLRHNIHHSTSIIFFYYFENLILRIRKFRFIRYLIRYFYTQGESGYLDSLVVSIFSSGFQASRIICNTWVTPEPYFSISPSSWKWLTKVLFRRMDK